MNDLIWTAVKRAEIPAVKEPVGLMQDGKRLDGATLIPWARGKPLAWDVTVPKDTYADSHIHDTAIQAGAAADRADINKCAKYRTLENSHIFFPVSIETGGLWNESAIELVQEIGKRITVVTEDSSETYFLFQRLSLVLQRGNVVSFLGTFPTE